jgi:hypothetical protein
MDRRNTFHQSIRTEALFEGYSISFKTEPNAAAGYPAPTTDPVDLF